MSGKVKTPMSTPKEEKAVNSESELRQAFIKRDASIRRLATELEAAREKLAIQEKQVSKLKALLKTAGGQIDRMLESPRWKWGSYLLFKDSGDRKVVGKMTDHYLEQFENWAEKESGPVVIISVFNAFEEVSACLESLVRHQGTSPHRILVIDDCSTDERIWPSLQEFAARYPQATAICNERNLGYTATINRACQLTKSDVVLLNSDTIVTPGWLEKLAACAYSRRDVATVTPLSNAAGAFSVPENNQANELPRTLDADGFNALLESATRYVRPVVPTGNGFCLYIRRSALDKIGLFDAVSFPRGYGEENDFCMRAAGNGFVNLIDDSTYIYHKRTASFGPEKESLVAKSKATLKRLHPSYFEQVKTWFANDPLDPLRERLRQRLRQPFTGTRVAFIYNSKSASSTRKRTFEPAAKLAERLPVETIHISDCREHVFRRNDVLIFQRIGGLNEHIPAILVDRVLTNIENFRKEGKTFLYDIDDYVFDSQDGIPAHFMMACDWVVASTAHLEKLAKIFNPCTLYLKNGIDYDRFLASPAKELDPRKFHVLCASLGAVGQSMLEEIARRLLKQTTDVEIHFFRGAAYSGKIPGVTPHEPVELEELFGFTKAADVVVNFDAPEPAYERQLMEQYGILPSQLDDFINSKSGLKYYNAGAAAKPFISTSRPICYQEMIRHGENGFIAETADEFVELILSLKRDAALRRRIGGSAFEDVTANYTLDVTVQEYVAALTSVVPTRRERPSGEAGHER